MTIDPRIQIEAHATIALDAATATGLTRLGFKTDRLELPADTDQAATLSVTLAPAADVDINFTSLAQEGAAPATDAEGVTVAFEKVYAIGIKASAPLGVSTTDAANPWVKGPFPATESPIESLCAVGEFGFGAESNSVIFANNGAESATLELIVIGHKA